VILERVTGQEYAEYLRDHVLRPAGLTTTRYCDERDLIPHRARGYDAVGTQFLNAPHVSMAIPFSAVGLCSTAGDLVTWERALRSGRVISRAGYGLMTMPSGPAARATPPYGFGVWVIQSGGRRYVSHLGQIDGFNAVLSHASDSLTIAVVANTSGMGASTLGGQLASVIRGIPGEPVEKAQRLVLPPVRQLTKAERGRYIGVYRLRAVGDGTAQSDGRITLRVFDENGRLTAQLTGDPPEVLLPLGNDKFVAARRPDVSLAFGVRAGRAVAVTVAGPDGVTVGSRVGDH
jgi:CubicO group peptidase (beta-lactamase class C family)